MKEEGQSQDKLLIELVDLSFYIVLRKLREETIEQKERERFSEIIERLKPRFPFLDDYEEEKIPLLIVKATCSLKF